MASQDASLIDSFPSKFQPRPVQTDIMKRIDDAIGSGYRNILLCAPTGVGKSHIAAAFAMALGSSHILTAQKILQDQYCRDFEWMYAIKGKSNFPCIDMYDYSSIPYETAASDPSVSCAYGNCSWQEDADNGKKATTYCKYKPMPDRYVTSEVGTEQERVESVGTDQICYYYDQKYTSLNASFSVFNYPAYFLARKYSSGIAHMLHRKSIVADEAHEIEDQLIDMIGIDIYRSHLTDVSLDMSDFDTGDVDGVKEMVEHVANVYHQYVAQNDGQTNDRQLAMYKNRRDHLDAIFHELDETPENMVIQPLDGRGISIKPIEVGVYAKRFFDAEHQLYMSATIHRDVFCKMMDLEPDECAYIEIERSPFAAENRKVSFLGIRRLSMRSTESDYAAVYAKVSEIMKSHADQKGLILTTRKDQCEEIVRAVRADSGDEQADRLKIIHNDSAQKRDVAIAEHAETDAPQVLLSPSLWYGVDLKDDLSRFQIIVKTPYLSLGEARTRIKSKKSQQWYLYASLTKLLQGLGRSVRGPDDHAVTYILDGGARDLIHRMRRFVPRSFADVTGL